MTNDLANLKKNLEDIQKIFYENSNSDFVRN